jgi:hypothetical protein
MKLTRPMQPMTLMRQLTPKKPLPTRLMRPTRPV